MNHQSLNQGINALRRRVFSVYLLRPGSHLVQRRFLLDNVMLPGSPRGDYLMCCPPPEGVQIFPLVLRLEPFKVLSWNTLWSARTEVL